MSNRNHNLEIRVMTIDGILVLTDNDFAEDAQYDWFDEILRETADTGDVVQLINNDTDDVIYEAIKE